MILEQTLLTHVWGLCTNRKVRVSKRTANLRLAQLKSNSLYWHTTIWLLVLKSSSLPIKFAVRTENLSQWDQVPLSPLNLAARSDYCPIFWHRYFWGRGHWNKPFYVDLECHSNLPWPWTSAIFKSKAITYDYGLHIVDAANITHHLKFENFNELIPTSITELFSNLMYSIALVFFGIVILFLCYKLYMFYSKKIHSKLQSALPQWDQSGKNVQRLKII